MPKKTLDCIINTNNTIILQVKSNQQFLLDEVDCSSKYNINKDTNNVYESVEKSHGRVESRQTNIFNVNINGWPTINLAATVIRKTAIKKFGKLIDTESKSYYITNRIFSAFEIHNTIRNHWAIESTNHNIRDTVLFEDSNMIKVKPENMMIIRSFGYNLIQSNLFKKSFTAQMESNKLNFENLFNFKGIKYE